MHKRGAADMTEGTIWKQLLQFSVPMAIGLLFQQLYNAVDAVVVGNYVGKEALAAVGSTSSIINMLVGVCTGLFTGAGVLISQRFGAHDEKGLHDAVHTTVALTGFLCIAATLAGLFIVTPMLRMMSTPADVFEEAKAYLSIYFLGVSGLLIYNMGSALLRAVGDSRRPLIFLCISAVNNIVFDLLFVIKFGLGVRGVSYATILSQCVSAVLVLYVLTHDHAAYGIRWRDIAIHRAMLGKILAIGLPAAVQSGITAFSNVFVQSYINGFGSGCMAGWSTHNKVDAFVTVPIQSISMASTTFVGQNWGARKAKRAREGVRQALMITIAVTAALAVIVMTFSTPILRLFGTDPEMQRYGHWFISIIAPFHVLICFNQIYAGALRGIGNAKVPMVLMLFSFVFFRQMFLLFNKLVLANSFLGVTLAYPLGWIVCSVLLTIYYRKSELYRPKSA